MELSSKEFLDRLSFKFTSQITGLVCAKCGFQNTVQNNKEMLNIKHRLVNNELIEILFQCSECVQEYTLCYSIIEK